MRGKATGQHAFSLIELLIVITLIFSISAAIGIRQFPSSQEINKRNIPEAMYDIGKHARLMSSELGQSVFVKFIAKNTKCQFRKVNANNFDSFATLFYNESGETYAKESFFVVCDECDQLLVNSLQEVGFAVVKGGINGSFYRDDKTDLKIKFYPSGICDDFNFKQKKSDDLDEYIDDLIYKYDIFSGSVLAYNSFGETIIEK